MTKPESSAENAQFLKQAQNTSARARAWLSSTTGTTAPRRAADDMPKSHNYCGDLAHAATPDCDNLHLAFSTNEPTAPLLKKQTGVKTALHDCR